MCFFIKKYEKCGIVQKSCDVYIFDYHIFIYSKNDSRTEVQFFSLKLDRSILK